MPKRKRSEVEGKEAISKADKHVSKLVSGKASHDVNATNDDNSVDTDAQSFTVPFKGKDIICERHGGKARPALIFTHGAGGGLSNPATQEFANGFADISPIVLFQGTMNLQSRVGSFQNVVEHEDAQPALGGRSMGARAAVLVAQQSKYGIKALVLASYPMVGAQKGETREQILLDLPYSIDVLFITGSNDSMCDMKHLRTITGKMKARSWIMEVHGADHGMSLKQKAGVQPIRKETGTIAARWLQERSETKRHCSLRWSAGDGKATSTGWTSSPEGNEAAPSSLKNWAKPVKT